MYTPAPFREDDPARIWSFVAANPFGVLVGVDAGGRAHATFAVFRALPPEGGAPGRLHGHIARENPHAAALSDGAEALAIFHGPHAFVSPGWYRAQPSVPTWNYAAVQIRGPVRLLADPAERDAAMAALVAGYATQEWRYDALPARYRDKMLAGITLFELTAAETTGKWKMSQNRSAADRQAVAAALAASGDAMEAEVAALVRATLPPGTDTGADRG